MRVSPLIDTAAEPLSPQIGEFQLDELTTLLAGQLQTRAIAFLDRLKSTYVLKITTAFVRESAKKFVRIDPCLKATSTATPHTIRIPHLSVTHALSIGATPASSSS